MIHKKLTQTLLLSVAAFGFVMVLHSCKKNITVKDISKPATEQSDEEVFTSVPIEGKYIVTLKYSSLFSPTENVKYTAAEIIKAVKIKAAALMKKYGDPNADFVPDFVYTKSILGFAGSIPADVAVKLGNDGQVAAIEQDQMISLGKPGSSGTSSPPPAQSKPWGITRVNGGVSYTGSSVAWILDTGIDLDHSDLNVNTTYGFTAFTRGKDATFDDGHGHGSHVSGTIAAIDNEIGVIGVAAGATVVPVKVLSSTGSGSTSGVIAGVDWVGTYGNPGDVANMSLGGGVSSALDNAVIAAASNSGVKFCVAAGNSSADANTSSPARANGTNVYTISAMDSKDVFASFSNYGNPPIDYCAPGVSIYSTYKNNGYTTMSGTSMATPHAAGVLLLGSPSSGGYVKNDRDATADVIIVH